MLYSYSNILVSFKFSVNLLLFSSHQIQPILQICQALLYHCWSKLWVSSAASVVRLSSRVNCGDTRLSLWGSTVRLVSQRGTSSNLDVLRWLMRSMRTSSVFCSPGVKQFLNGLGLGLDTRSTHHSWCFLASSDSQNSCDSLLAFPHSFLVVNDTRN